MKKIYIILLIILIFILIPFRFNISNVNATDTRYIIIKPDTDIYCQWTLFDTTHHDSVIDNNDNTLIEYTIIKIKELLGFNTNTLLTNEYISQLKLYSRGRCWNNIIYRPKFDYYWNNEYQLLNEIVELPITLNKPDWTINIISNLNGSQSDLDNLEIVYNSPINLPLFMYGLITEIYIEVEIILTENGNGIITNWQGIIIFFIIIMTTIFIIFIFGILHYIQK